MANSTEVKSLEYWFGYFRIESKALESLIRNTCGVIPDIEGVVYMIYEDFELLYNMSRVKIGEFSR